ncbi:MAG: branched-chain amino acid ABC transporter permease [Spirochaetales bacterium]|nr:branched-chain amino acid ABC transporter permease [Spirochaetales bacterium]
MKRGIANLYQELSRARYVKRIGIVVLLGLAVIVPFVASDYWQYVLMVAFYYTIMACTWNLLAGYTGQFSLSHHTFSMIGAYGSTLLMQHAGLPFWISIPGGIALVLVVSFLLGLLCLRVEGLYLVLVTWAFAEVVKNYIRLHNEFTGGARGLESPLLFGTMKPFWYYYLFLGLAVFTVLVISVIMRSKMGYYFRAIRDDVIAARSMGVDITRYKIIVVMIASTLAGMAGIFYGHSIGLISPTIGEFNEMAMIIIFVVIGGMRSLGGPVVGAVGVRVLMELLREYSEVRIVILSAVVILLMRFSRGGLKEILPEIRRLFAIRKEASVSAYDESEGGKRG